MKATESSPFVDLARRAIEHYVIHRRTLPAPNPLPPEMAGQAGAFVSLHKKDGMLRGCIGTIEPTQPNLAEEIIQNAISAAARDPRFPPVRPDEVADLSLSVDVLSPPEKAHSMDDLDPRRYGAIVRSGYRKGLLLPDLEGVDSPEAQVAICMDKAGISPNEPVELYRFEVKRYH
ncbi:MAG: AmmeMemoRadiSam system protein A [Armatimonadetes bacterium]|nr:AmmeMemoRadiSam system protein A [Armatimonadota bacterium]